MNPPIAVALTSHLIPRPSPITPNLWRQIAAFDESPQIIEWAQRSLSPQDASSIEARLALVGEAMDAIEELRDDGIDVVLDPPELWIQRFGSKCPPLLFVAGNQDLLNKPSVGVVGSRDIDPDGSEFAASIAAEIASLGYSVVSGGARGVDQIAMRAALYSGGGSVGILADSLRKTVRSSQDALESGSVCLATPFSPDAPFQVGNAMGRNRLVYGLSRATVVVATAEGSGGTWAGAVEAIEQRICPVLVRSGAGVPYGNQRLIRCGGIEMTATSELSALLDQDRMPQPSLFA